MAAVTICSDFGAQENKASPCFHCFPIYLPWSDGIACHDLSFLNVELNVNYMSIKLEEKKYFLWRILLQPEIACRGAVYVQISSVAQSCLTLCDPMTDSTPGLPVHHHLPEFTQTHAHRVCDAIQPSHPRSSPCPPAPNPSQHQSLFRWVSSSHEVVKVLELQL